METRIWTFGMRALHVRGRLNIEIELHEEIIKITKMNDKQHSFEKKDKLGFDSFTNHIASLYGIMNICSKDQRLAKKTVQTFS